MRLSSLFASALVPALASALTVNKPSSLVLGKPTNVTWVAGGAKDPSTFSLFLMGISYPFDLRQIIATNVDPSVGYITTTFPVDRVKVGEAYTVKAVNSTWVDYVFTQAPTFYLTAA